MKTKFLLAALLLCLIIPLAGCNNGEEPEPFDRADTVFYQITTDALKINIKNEEKKYVNTNVSMELSDDTMVPVFTERNYRLIQIINEYFRSLDLTTLQQDDIQEIAGEALVRAFNTEFKTDVVQKVYLPDFLTWP